MMTRCAHRNGLLGGPTERLDLPGGLLLGDLPVAVGFVVQRVQNRLPLVVLVDRCGVVHASRFRLVRYPKGGLSHRPQFPWKVECSGVAECGLGCVTLPGRTT